MEQLLYWLVGFIGKPIVNWLKEKFGFTGKKAVLLTTVVSVVLGAVALLMNDQLGWSEFSFEALVSAASQVLTAATLAYKLLTKE